MIVIFCSRNQSNLSHFFDCGSISILDQYIFPRIICRMQHRLVCVCVSTVWANNIVYILRHLLFLTNFILNDSTGSLNFAFCSLYSTTGWRVDSEMFKRHLRENYYFFLLNFRISCFFAYASLYHLRFWCLTFLNSRNIYTQQEQKAQVSIISFQVWDFGGSPIERNNLMAVSIIILLFLELLNRH